MTLKVLLCILGVTSAYVNLAEDFECGEISRGSRRLFARVMGGTHADITDFPHAVSLQKNGEHYCAGTLIAPDFVLTAAHCVHSYPARLWTVAVGSQNSYDEADYEQRARVEEIIVHPDFVFPKFVNDVALMKLDRRVKWSEKAKPICLPDRKERTGRGLGYLAGWGYDGEGGEPTKDLHMARLPILDNGVCQEWIKSKNKRVTLLPQQMCAGYEKGQTDGCQADSGGGLVVVEKGKLVLVGVVSAGFGCGRERLPGIYARVTNFMPWIEDVVESYRNEVLF